ncbi:MAG: prephenate dehydratase [Burkholderiales bacterium]|nr:prephenate dehydratase [Burkholderiales bacterium]
MSERLSELRQRIDEVDGRLLELLGERGRLVLEVGALKHATNAPVWRPEREAQILRRLAERNPGPLPDVAIAAVWREVISGCRELERRLRVAYLGPAGTFSEQAVLAQFGQGVEAVACVSIDEVFRATEAGTADFGVVPVENSSEGAVNRSLDLFLQSPLKICGEVSVPVRHHLLTHSGTMQGVTRICAHAQALAQCTGWLNRNYPTLERVPVSSNAEGARLAALEPHTAGIAGDGALGRYEVRVVAQSIQDDPLNRTRFAVIGNHLCGASGEDQTSLILSVPDRAGAVHALIEPLSRHGVSMKRFESRPARQGNWEYYFYIDLLGHEADASVAAALAEIRAHAAFFKSLGSYPREVNLTSGRSPSSIAPQTPSTSPAP